MDLKVVGASWRRRKTTRRREASIADLSPRLSPSARRRLEAGLCMRCLARPNLRSGAPALPAAAALPAGTAGLLWVVPALNGWDTRWSSFFAHSFHVHLKHLSNEETLLYCPRAFFDLDSHCEIDISLQNLTNPKELFYQISDQFSTGSGGE